MPECSAAVPRMRVGAHAERAGDGVAGSRVGERQPTRFFLQLVERVQRLVEFLDLAVEHHRAVERDQRPADIAVVLPKSLSTGRPAASSAWVMASAFL